MNKPEELERLPVMVVKIAARYVRKNRLRPTDVPLVLQTISDALRSVHEAGPIGEAPQPAPKLVPAVPIKKSLTDDVIICLEDGKKFKSLRRHLRVAYGMTPEEYRAKWGLPPDYPMVAPNYAAARSRLAREMGLGRKQAEDPAPVAAPKKTRKKAAA